MRFSGLWMIKSMPCNPPLLNQPHQITVNSCPILIQIDCAHTQTVKKRGLLLCDSRYSPATRHRPIPFTLIHGSFIPAIFPTMPDPEYIWLSSKDTQKRLHISGCELSHRREAGELVFEKRGNSYFYRFPTVSSQSQISSKDDTSTTIPPRS